MPAKADIQFFLCFALESRFRGNERGEVCHQWSQSQIRTLELWVVADVGRGAGQNDPPVLQDVGALRKLQALHHVLLDEQDGKTVPVDLRDEAEKRGSVATKENAERLLASARQRLSRWNLTEAQIDAIAESRAGTDVFQLVSPFRGVVETVGVDQGRRIMTGDHLVDVADLTSVWVWAEFYQEELPQIRPGMTVSLTSSSLPGEKLTGKIALVDPFLNDMKRTGRVRIDVENFDLKLRPDMYVDVELTLDRGEALTVPFSAVLPTGKHNIVFVDKGGGKLEPRFIELAGKFGDVYAVASGLQENERVVSSANFLIDAESKVQGALKSW